jgi:DNA-binding response OmpR family regulator
MEPFLALVLSSDPGPLSTTKKVLEEHGVTVRTAGSLAAANQLIKTTKLDLAIFDADIPGALDLGGSCSPVANPKIIFALVRNSTVSEKILITWLDSVLPCAIEAIPRAAARHERSLVEMQT